MLEELWEAGVLEEHLLTLLGAFERFPTEDGAGVLWGIVHGIEASPFDYDASLQRSIDRQPSFMGNLMLQRLEKSRAANWSLDLDTQQQKAASRLVFRAGQLQR